MYAEESFLAPKWTHRSKAALSRSGLWGLWGLWGLQARGAGVKARDGFGLGVYIGWPSMKPVFRPEGSPEWVFRTKRVVFLGDYFSMRYSNEAFWWGELSRKFGKIDRELR